MKKIMMTLMMGLMALQSFADIAEVKLDKKKIEINAAQVVVVRTAATPDKVHFKMTIPISRYECIAYDTRQVYGPDASCGSYSVPVTVCNSPNTPAAFPTVDLLAAPECHPVCNSNGCRQVCYEREHPGSGGSGSGSDSDHRTCHTEYVSHYHSCYHSETYCSAHGNVVYQEQRKIKLAFKDLTPLKEGEVEKFILSGAQGGRRLVYDTKFTLEVKESLRKYSVKEGAFYFLDPRLVVKQLP